MASLGEVQLILKDVNQMYDILKADEESKLLII